MSFYRLIKPVWARKTLDNGKPNPNFVEEIADPKNTHEGYNFTPEFLKQKNDEGYNVYFFPNHPSTDVYAQGVVALSGKHIDKFNYVFVDMDLKDQIYKTKEEFIATLKEFPLKPTMVVNSGNGVHAYWAINDLTRDDYVFTQLGLLKYFKTDESVFTVLQLMRLPGYNNTKKHKDYVPASIVDEVSSGIAYNMNDMPAEIFSGMTEVDINRGRKHLDRLDGKLVINAPEHVNLDEVPDNFFDFINKPENKQAYDLWMDPKSYGDRSAADMKLANILFKNNFNKKEALSIISNTQKALSHANRRHYADLTIEKVYTEKLNSKFMTVGQRNRTVDPEKNLGALVKGTWYFDSSVLGNPWRKRELLGLIAGTGVGKTTVTLKWIKDAIENNPENDDIYVFFSLEMTVGEVVTRWNNLVGKDSTLADRLYVIGSENENLEPRSIGLQEILEDCTELKKLTGKNIGMIAIDHIGIISRHINVKKRYKFGIESEANAGHGEVKTLSLNSLATQLKPLSKMLDTFIVVLTQTTKEKQGAGDLPIGIDGAYGISQYENIMDRIITIWQPLKLVQSQSKYNFLAWQYVKIRSKHQDDKIQTYEPKLLTFDLNTGDLKTTTKEEYEEFNRLYPQTHELRDAQVKKKGGVGYSIHLGADTINKVKASLGLVKRDNNAVEQIQSNKHTGTN